MFSLNIVPGTYRVLIHPGKGTGARESWHAAKVTCDTADLVTITGDGQLALVALPKTAPPPPPPPPPGPPAILPGQTVKNPPTRAQEGQDGQTREEDAAGHQAHMAQPHQEGLLGEEERAQGQEEGRVQDLGESPSDAGFEGLLEAVHDPGSVS